MTRRYGIDVSHYQNPAAPAGNTWEKLSEKSSFAIVRATYGCSPDPNAELHTRSARIEAMQVGLYHFFCSRQSILAQIDAFCAVAVKCNVGKGDILPALDIEDDGKGNPLVPAWEPLVRQARDMLVSEFGGVILYITQNDWHRLGAPAWMLNDPLWCAYYHPGVDPAKLKPPTPGGVTPAICQYRVGLYNPGAPFVLKEATMPNAIDQSWADAPLPLATTSPTMPATVPPAGGIEPIAQPTLWQQRLDALTIRSYEELDLHHDTDPAELAPESSK